jgi:prevent-host-death family protein
MTTNNGHVGAEMNIPAAIFKAECLNLMEEVARTGQPIVITKHGKPVAQLVPIPAQPESLFGYMKNTVSISGDIVTPVREEWSALSGDEDRLYGFAPKKTRARRSKGRK